jgi:hypothetical protein
MDRPDRLPIGPGRCETFRGVPKAAVLPSARISGPEVLDWHMMARYEWSRPLFPAEIAKQLKFQPNKYPAPELTDSTGRPMQIAPPAGGDSPPASATRPEEGKG